MGLLCGAITAVELSCLERLHVMIVRCTVRLLPQCVLLQRAHKVEIGQIIKQMRMAKYIAETQCAGSLHTEKSSCRETVSYLSSHRIRLQYKIDTFPTNTTSFITKDFR